MKVSQMMNRTVHTCGSRDSLNEAARKMWEGDCGCLPVVDEAGKLAGMITDRDVCMAAYTQGIALKDSLVEAAMAREPKACAPEDSLEAAEAIMREAQIRRLPVVDKDGGVVGIISLNDLALEFEREKTRKRKEVDAIQVAETLAAICSRRDAKEVSLSAQMASAI